MILPVEVQTARTHRSVSNKPFIGPINRRHDFPQRFGQIFFDLDLPGVKLMTVKNYFPPAFQLKGKAQFRIMELIDVGIDFKAFRHQRRLVTSIRWSRPEADATPMK